MTTQTSTKEEYDYIIVGAGIAGCVIASRLSQSPQNHSILLLEAGPYPYTTSVASKVAIPANAPLLKGSELDWDYATVPQRKLDFALGPLTAAGGKGVGGGSLINYGMWTRGDRMDYADWVRIAGDERWGWEGMLKYFRRSERHHGPKGDGLHGYDGPVETATPSSSGRKYPLREAVRQAWKETGLEEHDDLNDGNQLGMAEAIEAKTGGKRIDITNAYPLDRVDVKANALVKRVIISDNKVATGVELADGRVFSSRTEVIISAGSLRTPQLLMLSGIGPSEELEKHRIKQVVDAPGVGRNLWDHLALLQVWKLLHPEIGAAIGSDKWTDPKFMEGNAIDWWTNHSLPADELKKAMMIDNNGEVGVDHPLLAAPRCHLGLLVYYMGTPDGTGIATISLNHLPTSRGTVTLASADPKDSPVIDHKHLSTEKDQLVLRTGARKAIGVMNTPAGKEIVSGELVAPGKVPSTLHATDREIDVRIREQTQAINHPAGTAAMGRVVDGNLQVFGVKGFRVVDASVIPTPISSPIQACVYALAEQAVDIILGNV